jgi:hypothetical protein
MAKKAAAAAGDPDDNAKYEAHKQRQAQYQRAISAAGREIGAIPAVVDPERRERAKTDLKFHLLTYHPRAFRLGFSKDHEELIEALQHVMLHGGKLAIAMPRGTGKTTVVTRAMGWAILHGHLKYVVFIAATDTKAQKAMLQLRREIENGETLIEDFPEACYPVRCLRGIANRQAGQTCGGKPTRMEWGALKLVFATVEGSSCSGSIIECGGITGAIARGPQHVLEDGEVIRPDGCLIDDFQTRESARSPMQVEHRLEIIEGDIAGMAGPDEGLACVATVTVIEPNDGADRLLNHDLFPHWNGIRKKFLLSFPTNMKLWEQYAEIRRQSFQTYRDIRLATEFYKKNRKKMDEGAEVAWNAKFIAKAHEISGIQHAMEWFIGKPRQFMSELQNAPEEAASSGKQWLKTPELAGKMHHLKQRQIPLGVRHLVAHIDVHDDLLYWAVVGYTPNGTGFLVDRGTYPDQGRRYFMKSQATKTMSKVHPKIGLDGAIAKSLEITLKELLDREYPSESSEVAAMDTTLIGVDTGHNPKVVNRVIALLQKERRYRNRITGTRGFGVGPGDTPFAERKLKDGQFLGNNWVQQPTPKDAAPLVHIDTNFWKTATNDRFATGIGDTGSLSLFHHTDHQLFSEHMTAEHGTETQGKGRTVYVFKLLPGRDNHWYDNVVTCGVLASILQCDTPATPGDDPGTRSHVPPPPKSKKKKRSKVAPLKV